MAEKIWWYSITENIPPYSRATMDVAFQHCRAYNSQEVSHDGSRLKGWLNSKSKFLTFGQTGRRTRREDYDIAMLRIDYPIMDEGTGITVLQGNKFDTTTIMPICLPPNKGYVAPNTNKGPFFWMFENRFRDTQRSATAVGMGITAQKYFIYPL